MDQLPNVPFQSNGGPQFGTDEQDGWNKKTRGWLNKYGSSVILPIIALLILAGGIYLYARQKTGNDVFLPEESILTEQELPEINQETSEQETAAMPEEENEEIALEPTITQEETIQEIIPQTGSPATGSIKEKAAKGEGVTHLSRRAINNYLKNKPKNLTNEHKVFIEDYLKDKTGSRQLEVGEEISFSEKLIEEAINASAELSAEQLKNLEKYSTLINFN